MKESSVSSAFAPWRIVSGAFVLALAFLFFNGRTYPTNDSVPYRYLPEAFLVHRTLTLEAFPFLETPENYAVIRDRHGVLISKKPVLPGLMQVPAFAMRRVVRGEFGDDAGRIRLGKWTMSVLAALAAGLLAATRLARGGPPVLALVSGAGLVACTPLWFTAMDAWPHPLLAALQAASLLVLARRERACATSGASTAGWETRAWAGIGFLQALAVAARPASLAVFGVFAVAALVWPGETGAWVRGTGRAHPRWRRAGAFFVGAALPLMLVGACNAVHFGMPWKTGFDAAVRHRIRLPFTGVAGLLFSPAKGLFLFSPVLLAMFAAPRASAWRDPLRRLCLAAFLLHTVVWAMYADWWGGWGWGPRYLTEAMPFAVFLASDHVRLWSEDARLRLRRFVLGSTAALFVVSLGFQALGAWRWDGAYHARFDAGWGEGRHWVWSAPFEPVWRLAPLERAGDGETDKRTSLPQEVLKVALPGLGNRRRPRRSRPRPAVF